MSCPTVGKEKYKDFVNARLRKEEISVHDPIKRRKTKLLTLKSFSKKPKTNQRKSVKVNRDTLAKLLAISLAREKVIDFKKALQFPLGEVPLSLCNPDGCMRKTNKGRLGQIVMKEIDAAETDRSNERAHCIHS